MRVIKIPASIDESMAVLDVKDTYPEMNVALFGDDTCLIEQVFAKGLHQLVTSRLQFVLLVDEEGLLKDLPLNKLASILYGTHVHGQPICGDAYVVASTPEEWIDLPEDVTVETVGDAVGRAIKFGAEVFG